MYEIPRLGALKNVLTRASWFYAENASSRRPLSFSVSRPYAPNTLSSTHPSLFCQCERCRPSCRAGAFLSVLEQLCCPARSKRGICFGLSVGAYATTKEIPVYFPFNFCRTFMNRARMYSTASPSLSASCKIDFMMASPTPC